MTKTTDIQRSIANALSSSGTAGSGASLRIRGLVFEVRREAADSLDLTVLVRKSGGSKRYLVGDCKGSAQAADLIAATIAKVSS